MPWASYFVCRWSHQLMPSCLPVSSFCIHRRSNLCGQLPKYQWVSILGWSIQSKMCFGMHKRGNFLCRLCQQLMYRFMPWWHLCFQPHKGMCDLMWYSSQWYLCWSWFSYLHGYLWCWLLWWPWFSHLCWRLHSSIIWGSHYKGMCWFLSWWLLWPEHICALPLRLPS